MSAVEELVLACRRVPSYVSRATPLHQRHRWIPRLGLWAVHERMMGPPRPPEALIDVDVRRAAPELRHLPSASQFVRRAGRVFDFLENCPFDTSTVSPPPMRRGSDWRPACFVNA
eukprot:CAMPEP_0181369628 /NCGR_PEP_ID=MMETSP1106-20121128/12904_1 /TAXON_ID=81844 /ORGANISM="Mantoniella antarctica, Strain SL-175" /LENGTH=114 /DNA_ID=CAMNT_0023486187 /DNA_START=203 /DNA_END=545 /DNA_ORIENTATION=+